MPIDLDYIIKHGKQIAYISAVVVVASWVINFPMMRNVARAESYGALYVDTAFQAYLYEQRIALNMTDEQWQEFVATETRRKADELKEQTSAHQKTPLQMLLGLLGVD